jgi:hypothetical protein
LPKAFGLVDPYIQSDPEEKNDVPDEHRQILELLMFVEDHQGRVSRQDAEEIPTDSTAQPSAGPAGDWVKKIIENPPEAGSQSGQP